MKPLVLTAKLSGHYKMEGVNVITGERRLLAEFENLITDIGLNRLGSGGFDMYCRVGSGSTPPAFTDTSLVSQLGATSMYEVVASSTGHSSSAPWYGWQRQTYRFAAGVAAGNVSEVGLGWSNTGATLFSRALVKDAEGNPTTITVLSDEYLDVTYELRNYAPVGDVTFDISISGTVYHVTGRASQATSEWTPGNIMRNGFIGAISLVGFNGPIGAVTGAPSGSQSSSEVSAAMDAYSNNSLKRSGMITFGLTQANLTGGIQSFMMRSGTGGTWQFQLSANVMKDATKVLRLGAEFSWARNG